MESDSDEERREGERSGLGLAPINRRPGHRPTPSPAALFLFVLLLSLICSLRALSSGAHLHLNPSVPPQQGAREMAGGGDNSQTNGARDRAMEEGRKDEFAGDRGCFAISIPFVQKIIAEIFGTYFLIFAGCGAVTINASKNGAITFPGVAIVWGLAVMVMVYAVGHISGAHFNPAVTLAFATCGRFPWRQLPAYVLAQMLGSTLASGTLRLMFGGRHEHFPGTLPTGSDVQSLVIEIITTFYLMFVISGVATDNRAIGELAGLAVGATILLNVLIAGPVSGASMNPARSVGPALVSGQYRSIWVYLVGPVVGAVAGAWAYNLIRFTNKPLRELTKSTSFLRSMSRMNSTAV